MKWKPWFAWYPVKLQLDNQLKQRRVWFRWVEYYAYKPLPIVSAYCGGSSIIYHYRLPDSAPEFRMLK